MAWHQRQAERVPDIDRGIQHDLAPPGETSSTTQSSFVVLSSTAIQAEWLFRQRRARAGLCPLHPWLFHLHDDHPWLDLTGLRPRQREAALMGLRFQRLS
mgnify:CR=1 FL=1